MDIIAKIREKARSVGGKKIILPEWEDVRVLKAALKIIEQKIAKIMFLGKKSQVENNLKDSPLFDYIDRLGQIEFFDYSDSVNVDRMVETYVDIPGSEKTYTDKENVKNIILENKVYCAALLCRLREADGFVAGATCASKDVIKAALHCLDRIETISRISSSFIMVVPDCVYQRDGFFIFSDCGVIKDPTSEHLTAITVSSVDLFESINCEARPKVALLSYSTKGSAEGVTVHKIREALVMIKQRMPGLLVDGELQVDAALVENVAKRKASDTIIKGDANILIFPNLEAGNIAYKLVQRLAKARAIGPLLNGFNVPCSDLSRGCSVDDIVDAVAVTAIRS